jgi:hypothetical protein
MPLAQVPLDCDPEVIADWFEFHVLCSEFSFGQIRMLQRAWDKRKNSENANPEGREVNDNAADELFVETIINVFRERIECLNDDYPFKFNNSGEELQIKNELTDGAILYLFCLFLSNFNNSEIFELDKFSYELTNRVRDLFGACSTWAAAGFINGAAIAFGFPRPDGSPFLAKLRECYGFMGEGQVRDEPLPGVSTNPKDEGVDVIAWAPRPDRAPGKPYVLGQVASGGNWPNKSIKEYFRPFHENWFSEIPASDPVAALFIPFCITLVSGADLQQQVKILTKRYGQVHYRYTLPRLAQNGLHLAANNRNLIIERVDEMPEIKAWVIELIDKMKYAAAAMYE